MPRKHKKVSSSIPAASSGIATQNSFSLLSSAAPAVDPNPPEEEDSSPAGSPPSKKRREGPSTLTDPDTGVSNEKPKGRLETRIHTLAQQRAKELHAVARASEAIAAAIDSALASLDRLAKAHG